MWNKKNKNKPKPQKTANHTYTSATHILTLKGSSQKPYVRFMNTCQIHEQYLLKNKLLQWIKVDEKTQIYLYIPCSARIH